MSCDPFSLVLPRKWGGVGVGWGGGGGGPPKAGYGECLPHFGQPILATSLELSHGASEDPSQSHNALWPPKP